MFFGHLPEILLLLVIALLVFGPKRMIEMGSSLGKAVRELREATKDVNMSNLMSGNFEPDDQASFTQPNQFSQSIASDTGEPIVAAPPAAPAMPSVEVAPEPIDEARLN